jgi:hypothetical protein
MAFLIYKRTVQDNGLRYERLQSLKLAGADGLIARHVQKLPAAEQASWRLDVADLLALAGTGLPVVDLAVLFDVSDPDAGNVCLYELTRLHGSCRDTTTQLALDFAILVDQNAADSAETNAHSFVVPFAENRKRLGEILALSGGPGGGTWKWTAPGMNLGTTVVQPHGHGGGEPCANCTCGRKVSETAAKSS